jgi:Ca2+-binding RTX toxin-like protein
VSAIETLDGAANPSATNLTITAVSGATDGTVSLSNGVISFTPTANYSGNGAGFNYTETDAQGQVAQGSMSISIPFVAQNITLSGPGNTNEPIYGYSRVLDPNSHSPTYDYVPFFQPGVGWDAGGGHFAYRSTPIATGTNPYTGQLTVADPNISPDTFTVQQGRYGTATVSASGVWTYTPKNYDIGGSDAFVVTVTDGYGKTATETITVPLNIPQVIPGDGVGGPGDPIVLDLQGKGISITPLAGSTTYFDTTGSGYSNQTAWIAPSDAFLVFNPTHATQMSSASTINFANLVPGATSDYAALQAFDTNNTGVLNASNSIWNDLYVWTNANSDGVTDTGQLETLAQAGITSINLAITNQTSVQNGIAFNPTFSATMNSGSTIAAAEVNLPNSNQVSIPNPNGTTTVETQPTFAPPSTISGDGLLLGTSGNCTITGGAGNDVVMSGNGDDQITVGDGTDVIYAGNGDDFITAGKGNDVITTGNGNDLVTAGNGNDAVNLGGGNDVVFIGNGNDLVYTGNGNDVVKAGDGNDTLIGGGGAVALFAGNGNDLLQGGAGVSQLQAGSGNDTLQAGAGVSTLVGGSGNDAFDTFIVNNAKDVVTAQAGAAQNSVQTTINYTLGANIENLTGLGSANLTLTGNSLNNVILGNAGNDTLVAGSGNDTLIAGTKATSLVGGSGNNTYVIYNSGDVIATKSGSLSNNVESAINYTLGAGLQNLTGIGNANLTLTGNSMVDVITANGGNDTLVAGSGLATLVGGAGNDTFVVNNVADVINAQSGNQGNNVESSVSFTLANGFQTLTGTGAGNLSLTGNTGSDIITANSGNDTLTAGSGASTLVGGSGSDTFVVNSANDVISLAAMNANDSVLSSSSYTLVDNLQNLKGTGTGNLILTGNDLSDVITANTGNDTLVAGSGVATLIGGSGNETFIVNNANDVIMVRGNRNTVEASANYTLGASLENLEGIGFGALTLTGNSLSDVITANYGNDTLVAGSGVATLIGGVGNDTFVINNTADVVQARASNNTIQTTVSYTAASNVQTLADVGAGGITLTGNANASTLVSGTGADTLVGASGNDTFVVNNANDVVQEALAGNSTIDTAVNYVAANNVSNLTATGSAAITLTGNALNDVITANGGNDTLVAGSGIDTLNGGSGNDTFVINNTADVVNAGTGVNTVQTSVSDTLGANVQFLTGTGSAALTLTGNNLNDVIKGNSGKDTLIAGSGNDTLIAGSSFTTLIGGSGNDTFVVTGGTDVISEAPNSGNNTEEVLIGGKLADNVQNLVGLGSASIALFDNNQTGDVITANSGRDTLYSGTGADTLIGGANSDMFYVNNAADVIEKAPNAGTNVEFASVSVTMAANIQVLTGTGPSNLMLTGNNLDIVIRGSAAGGNDTLIAGSGNDSLFAGSGLTTMIGGIGNDTFTVNNAADVVTENVANTGSTISTSVSYALSANLQYLIATGSGNLTLTGNSLNDVITANAGNDSLIAGSGIDTLIAGSGNDTLIAGSGGTTYQIGAASGVVTINGSMSSDTLSFGSGISAANLSFAETSSTTGLLTLTIHDTQGKDVVINNYSNGDVDKIQFADGSTESLSAKLGQISPNASAMPAAATLPAATGIAISAAVIKRTKSDQVVPFNSGNVFGFPPRMAGDVVGKAGTQWLSPWTLSDALMTNHLGNNTATLGSDLSSHEGLHDDLPLAATATLSKSSYGKTAQNLNVWSDISKNRLH